MRPLASILLNVWIASLCAGQSTAPIPADPYELVTGNSASAKPADRTQALALLNKAKRPMRLLAPMTPPYFLSVSFTAMGDAANSGPGEFSQLWLGSQNSRWTAKFGDVYVSRVHTNEGTFDEKRVPLVPMRVHMLRNALFWAAQGLTAASQFRSAAVALEGRPATCLLVSDQPEAVESPARRWDESEYCIDDQTQLLKILSVAPGSYTVYSYAAGQSFQGQPMPDRIKTYLGGLVAIDANVRIDEPSAAGSSPPALTAEMIAAGRPVGLDEPLRRILNFREASTTGAPATVVVNAQVGPDGKVVNQELCVATDRSLTERALDRVKTMEFGRSDVQRQAYVEVRFSTPSAAPITAPKGTSTPRNVPAVPYYLERTVSMPNSRFDTKEILGRRSDGATVRMAWVGPADHGQFVRELKFPDGRSLTLYDSVKAKVTWPALSEVETSLLRSKAVTGTDCSAGRTLLRHDQVAGEEVDVFQNTAGPYRVALWAAPRLGCESLYVNSEAIQQDGSFRPSAETKTTRLVIGEPQAYLFEIAPDLVEAKPSEAMRRLWESLDLGLDAEQKAAMLRDLERQGADADRRYQSNRK
jgi:hypothetical protein